MVACYNLQKLFSAQMPVLFQIGYRERKDEQECWLNSYRSMCVEGKKMKVEFIGRKSASE